MKLTTYTDYALRTLMYLATHRDRLVTISDIAEVHGISKNHLMKVVYQLGLTGMVETVRGRNGGLRLNREPADINVGEVVRNTETDFNMAECFDPSGNQCLYSPACVLKDVLHTATTAYLDVLDNVTLEFLVSGGKSRKKPAAIRMHPPRTRKEKTAA
ncbi:MAG: Rrf2 family transcriptional regulator [Thiobacillus sp.]|jgi:Rrf2 family nitric oxide-sensitive transcriptional repressor|uniref:RrF2 family transcriptional regulator n=1 Tax=Thiobacillus sp. TaxID=924 RepID=UPI0028956FB1|nr:Rrf2 family transcriptional regulator [Thiobacillus sp.]MDT3707851.1 Rrf2 family transcriptional regulator [Thiobacillus sp.]